MKKYIPLVLAFLIITLTACNKDDSPTTPEDTSAVVTTAETTTSTTSTVPTTTTPPITTTTTAVTTTEPPETTTTTTTTTPAPVTTTTPAPQTQLPTPTATNPPPTQAPPPPTTTTTATTEPPVAFDPQIYVDYAIEYAQSIGLEYDPMLGNYEKWGGDKPLELANWNSPVGLTSDIEDTKRRIREHCNGLINRDGAVCFRPKVYHTTEVNWRGGTGYLLFVFWARN